MPFCDTVCCKLGYRWEYLPKNVTLRFATVGAVWRPKKGCELSSKYEINIENNEASSEAILAGCLNICLSD